MAMIVYPVNGVTYNAEDVQTYLSTRTSGVFGESENFGIGGVDKRNIVIRQGLAWIKYGDMFSGVSVALTEDTTVSIPASSQTLNRVDRIVLRLDLNQQPYVASIAVVEGVPASSPVAPPITRNAERYELGLYTIDVPAGSTAIIDPTDIHNTMTNKAVCGIMASSFTEIDTTYLTTHLERIVADANGLVVNAAEAIESFNDAADGALENLQESVNNIAGGTDYMLQTAFNPKGGVGQVAFESDIKDIKTDTVRGYWYPSGTSFLMTTEKNIRRSDFEKGMTFVLHLYPLKFAGESPTTDERRNANRFLTGNPDGFLFKDIFDSSKETVLFSQRAVKTNEWETLEFIFYGFFDGFFSKIIVEDNSSSGKIVKLIRMEAL